MNEKNRSQMNIPSFFYGTAWKEERTRELTKLAIETGFRGIDTANQRKHYYEEGVGEAITEAIEEDIVDRDDLFLQTKFTFQKAQDDRLPYDPDASVDQQVRQSLERSLEHLNTEYVDSLILHGPSTRKGLEDPDRTVWRTFEELIETETVKSIGISNVVPNQLEALIEFSEIKPQFVQNRCYARQAWDRMTRDICDRHGMKYQGFSLLTANQSVLQSDLLQEIARDRDRTVPQVIFRFTLQLDMIPLTGTTSEEHMKQDLACLDFELDEEEIRQIEEVGIAG